MSMTPEEMATDVVKEWIKGQSGNADYLAEEIKKIYAAVIDAFYNAANRDQN